MNSTRRQRLRPAAHLLAKATGDCDRRAAIGSGEIVQRVRDGRLRTNIGNVSTHDKAVAAFSSTERRAGKTVIRVRPSEPKM